MRAPSVVALAALLPIAVAPSPGWDREGEARMPGAGAAVLTYKVTVTPKPGLGPERFADSSGFTAQFTVTNTGTATDTYTLTCSGSSVVCTNQSATVATLGPGQFLNVTVTYSTSHTTGTAYLDFYAESPNTLVGHGWWIFTLWTKVTHAVSVTPVNAVAPNRTSFTSGYTAAFTVKNVGTARDSFNLFCQPASNVTCSSQTLTTTPGQNSFDSSVVTITYATGPSGPGFVNLEAVSANASGTGTWNFTVLVGSSTAVAVIPDGQAIGVLANVAATRRFTVRNPGTASSTYNITASCSGAAIASGCTLSQASLTLGPGASGTDTVRYTSGALGTSGRILLKAVHSVDPSVKDTGWVTVTTGTAQQPAVAVADPGGATLARGLCLTVALGQGAASECGDLRLAHALPAVRTLGRVRTPSLEYSSATAHPYPLVAGNVTLPTGAANPDSLVVRLLVGQNLTQRARTSWSGSGMSPGRASRVVIGYDGLTDATGIYNYTLEVVSWYAGAAQPAVNTTGQYVVVNRKDSPFGAGWWLTGLEQLNVGSLVWVGGDGSVRQYIARTTQAMTNCVTGQASPALNVYVGPKVDRPDTVKFDGGCYTRFLPGGAKVRLDAQGRQIATVNRLGDTTSFHYNAAGRLDTLKVPPASAAARYLFSYDTTVTPPRLKTVTAPPAGASARIDSLTVSAGTITAIKDPDGTTVAFGYDGTVTNRAVSRTNRRSTPTNFAFDAAGKVAGSTVDASGLAITTALRTVESAGFTATPVGAVVDTAVAYTLLDGPRTDVGDSTLFWVDRFGAPRRIRNALGAETMLSRTDTTWPAAVTRVQSPNGRVVTATYDVRGHLKTSTDSGTIVNGQAATTRYEWNMTWDAVERIVPPELDSTVIGYDAGNGNRVWQQDGRGMLSRVTFGYSASTGLLTSMRLPGATKADSLHYDPVRANPDSSWTPLGFRTVTFTDAIGRDTLVLTPIDSAQTLVQRQRSVYDLADRVTDRWTISPPLRYQLDSGFTTFMPDTTRVTAETLFVANTYDGEGNVTLVDSWTAPAHTIDLELLDFRKYDTANRLLTRRLGSDATSFNYDPAGNAIGLGFTNGAVVTQTFDVLNRLVNRVIPSVDYAQTTCDAHQGVNGPLTSPQCSLRFPLYPNNGTGYRVAADTSTFTYDVIGNLLEADNADARISRTYGLNGTVLTDTQRLRDVLGNAFSRVYGIRYGYDRDLRRAWTKLPLMTGDSVTYSFSPSTGGLSQIRDNRGRLFTFAYDSAGRPDTLRTYPAAGQPAGITETRTFDPDGRMVQRVRGSLVNASLRYDARGKVIQAHTTDAAHNHEDELTLLAYDGLGAVVGSQVVNLRYQIWDAQEYRYDGFGNAWWNKHSSDHAAELPHLSSFSSRSGALTYKVESPPNPGQQCANSAIRFDSVYQKLDFAGSVRDAGEIVWICFPNWGFSRQIATRYFNRADNRLKVVQRYDQFGGTDKNGTWEEYRYDALGRRVLVHALRDSLCRLSQPGTDCTSFDQRTIWDGDQVLAEDRLSSSGSTETTGTVAYIHGRGLDQPLAILDSRSGMDGRVPNANWRGLGESSSWTDGTPADCSVTAGACTTINWPAGEGVYFEKPLSQSWPPPATWVGSIVANGEDGTSLLYRRNRFYDPASGQFTQQDPLGLGGGMNVYGFAAGDPVNFGDPFGLSCEGQWKDKRAAITPSGICRQQTYAGEIVVDRSIAANAASFINEAVIAGAKVQVNSSFRNLGDQLSQYLNHYVNGEGRYDVATPGSSAHEAGFAIDIQWRGLDAYSQNVILEAASHYGFAQTNPKDPVHFQNTDASIPAGIAVNGFSPSSRSLLPRCDSP